MESSSPSLGLQYPARSISLPSRLHPNAIKIEAELNKLRSAISTETPLSVEAIQTGVVGLAELYNCVQGLSKSSTTQKGLLQHQNGIIVEEALEESVVLLDSCSNIQNLFLMIKQHVQDLQSALRRKSGEYSSIESDIASYLCFRKKVNKDVTKSLRDLKHMDNKIGHWLLSFRNDEDRTRGFNSELQITTDRSLVTDLDHHLAMVIRVLREVTVVTISVLRSLLLFLSWPASKTKSSGWSYVSRLVLTKSAKRDHIISDVGSVDIALTSLHRHFRNSDCKAAVQLAQRRLGTLDASIATLDTSLECMFRQLVQHRVSFFNMLTQ